MPSKAKCKTMVGPGKKYKSMSDCMSYGGKKMGKAQKAGTSAKSEQDMVGTAMAKSKNARMKNRLKKQAMSSPKGY
jgi:hypothetical protein|tara:strand:- start:148 stop:375 length:228 start_codon:yes stop_codon:yes gene_type:complete